MSATTTARPVSAEETGRRVEEVLDRLTANGDPAVAAAAEELVRSLMDYYGSGLARALHLLSAAPGDPLARLLGDELVASLLVLHDLHPEDRDTRIGRALDSVREHDLDVVGFDEDSGTLTLRAAAAGGGCGCGSGAGAREAAQAALACFAPEVRAVEVESAPALLQIGTKTR
ncbi:hypothetical protein EJ357_37460 [Streptomyces cyaneochromogenes]|uniref:NifU family protein n=1 Tax=Streptomyces cyaneochromogenes TaxID=2496836 RepID=A0A3S9MH13_9ACTN|nr:hypothetical protein [Streptomyces cyaneochromogenes]AZQ38446.1 hypothetical protein EJ357_37460 [Streptomyces cyaneochromogenes]